MSERLDASMLESIVREAVTKTANGISKGVQSTWTASAMKQAAAIANAGGTVIEDVPTNIKGLANRGNLAAASTAAVSQPSKSMPAATNVRTIRPLAGLQQTASEPVAPPQDIANPATLAATSEAQTARAAQPPKTPAAYGSLPTPEMQPGFSGKRFDIRAPYKIERDANGPTMGQRIAEKQAAAYPEEYHALPERHKAPEAVDVKKLSWRERKERLEQAGKLLGSDEVRGELLRKPGERDIVKESERRWAKEQQDAVEGRTPAASPAPSKPATPPSDRGGVDTGRWHGPQEYGAWRASMSPAERLQEGLRSGEGMRSAARAAWIKTGAGKPFGERLKAGWKSLQENMASGGDPIDRRGDAGGAGGGGKGPTTGTPDGPAGGDSGAGGGMLGGLSGTQLGAMARKAYQFSNSPLGRAIGATTATVGGIAGVVGGAVGAVGTPGSKPLETLGNTVETGATATGTALGTLAGGPVGAMIGGLVGGTIGKVFGGIIKAPEAIKDFAEALMRGAEHLRRFDAGINTAAAQLELNQLQMDRQTAMGTSGSTQNLSKHLIELRQQLQPISQDWANLQNNVAAIAAQGLTALIKSYGTVDKLANYVMPLMAYNKMVMGVLWKWLTKSDPGKGSNQYLSFLADLTKAEKWGGKPMNQRPGERPGGRLNN